MDKQEVQEKLTRNELKIRALLERVSDLENEKSDLRVELTLFSAHNERLVARVKELEELVPQEEDASEADEAN